MRRLQSFRIKNKAIDAIVQELADLHTERFNVYGLALSGSLYFVRSHGGTKDRVDLGPSVFRSIASASQQSFVGIVVAHNHPGGKEAPSEEDDIATSQLAWFCSRLGTPLVDHLVVPFGATEPFRYSEDRQSCLTPTMCFRLDGKK